MKKLKMMATMVIAVVVMVGCGGKSLSTILTEGNGEWYLSSNEIDIEMMVTFESKDEATIEMFGESETTNYSVSKENVITLKSKDDEDDDSIEIKVTEVKEDTMDVKIGGSKGKLSKTAQKTEKSEEDVEESTDSEEDSDRYSADEDEYLEMLEEMEDNGIEVDNYGTSAVTFTGEKNVDHDYFQVMISYHGDEPYDAEVSLEEHASYDDKLRFEIEKGRMVEYYKEEKSDFTKLKAILESIGYSDKELIKFTGWYLEEEGY